MKLHKMNNYVEGIIVFSVMNLKQQCTSPYLKANVKGYHRVVSEHNNDLYNVNNNFMNLNENIVTK